MKLHAFNYGNKALLMQLWTKEQRLPHLNVFSEHAAKPSGQLAKKLFVLVIIFWKSFQLKIFLYSEISHRGAYDLAHLWEFIGWNYLPTKA